MTDMDHRAVDLAHALHRRMDAPLGADHYGLVAAVLRAVEAETIERCAQIAEQCWLTDADGNHADCARTVADNIRAIGKQD